MNPLRVLVIGDLHFKTTNVVETTEMCIKLVDIASTFKPDIIVCLGDTLDKHANVHLAPYTQAITFIKRLRDIAPVYLLIGNHDRTSNNDYLSSIHPFVGLSESTNITVVDTTKEVVIKGYRFIFVPYVPVGKLQDALNLIPNIVDCSAVFAHQEIRGCAMANGVSTNGDVWPIDYPLLISGHIHKYHSPQPNIVYAGTPIQHKFGDSDDNSVSLFTFSLVQEGEEAIEEWTESRIHTNLTKRITLEIEAKNFMNWTIPVSNRRELIRLLVYGNSSEIQALNQLNILKDYKTKGVKIEFRNNQSMDLILPEDIEEEMDFLTDLEDHVKNIPGVYTWYTRIFKEG